MGTNIMKTFFQRFSSSVVCAIFAVASTTSSAATISVDFSAGTYGTNAGTWNLSVSKLQWIYDDVANTLTTSGGVFFQPESIDVGGTLYGQFTHYIENPVFGPGNASASLFNCIEGVAGAQFNTRQCGAYNFGGNLLNNSTITYGPGTNALRTLGGDDVSLQPHAQYIGWWNNMAADYNPLAGTLTMSNQGLNAANTSDYFSLTFAVVPVPPAVWLFGSALGLMGVIRRKLAS
jgi:hypothetical protein